MKARGLRARKWRRIALPLALLLLTGCSDLTTSAAGSSVPDGLAQFSCDLARNALAAWLL